MSIELDRQTDARATYWSITAWDDEILLLEDTSRYREMKIVKVYGGREIAPLTGKEHFQGMIQLSSQQRLAHFKTWFKKAHFEPARKKSALENYVMKSETAAGDKTVRESMYKHYSADQVCMEIARRSYEAFIGSTTDINYKSLYLRGMNSWLREEPAMMGQLMNPSLKNAWIDTAATWYYHVARELEESSD